MTAFDRVIVADWSAASALSPPRPAANAIWLGITDKAGTRCLYFRSRATAEAFLWDEIRTAPGRLLIGFDFPMGYPAGFAARLTGAAQAPAVWHWLANHLIDGDDNRNNRFDLAAQINARIGGGPGPFWGRPKTLALPELPDRKTVDYPALGLAERRRVETLVRRAQPVWKLYTTGAAGGQGLVGQAMLHRLCQRDGVAVWPFHPTDTPADAPVVLAEVYPSLLGVEVAADPAPIKDEVQVRLLSRALWRLSQAGHLAPMLALPEPAEAVEEGWILGAGQTAQLQGACR